MHTEAGTGNTHNTAVNAGPLDATVKGIALTARFDGSITWRTAYGEMVRLQVGLKYPGSDPRHWVTVVQNGLLQDGSMGNYRKGMQFVLDLSAAELMSNKK